MSKHFSCLFAYVFILCAVSAQIYMNDNPLIQKIEDAYLYEGKMPPFYTFPQLPVAVISAAQESSVPLDTYTSFLQTKHIKFSTSLFPMVHFFLEEKTIENVERDKSDNGIDFLKNYESLPPVLSFAAELWNKGGFGGGMFWRWRTAFNANYFLVSNVSFDIDSNLFYKGYVYYNSPYISLLIGRTKTHIGVSEGSTLYPSDNVPWLDAIRLTIPFGPYIRYYYHVANIPAVKSVYQQDVKTGNDYKDAYFDSLQNNGVEHDSSYLDYFYGFEDDDFPSLLLNIFHRIGFQNDFLRIGIAENVFLVRRNNRFEFVDLFPFIEWHGTDVIPNNMSFLFDVAIVPTKNLLIGAQFGFDEINGNGVGIRDTNVPTVWAATAHIKYVLNMSLFDISFITDGGYTHYLWGNFSGYSTGDNSSGALARALYRYHTRSPLVFPMTSPFGPGALWVSEKIHFVGKKSTVVKNMSANISWTLLFKEKDTNLIETPYAPRSSAVTSFLYNAVSIPIAYAVHIFEIQLTPSVHYLDDDFWMEMRLGLRIAVDMFL